MSATEGGLPSHGERSNETLDSRVATESSSDEGAEEEDQVPDVQEDVLRKPTGPAPEAVVVADCLAGRGIPALTLLDSVALDHGAEGEKRREGVGELQNAEGGDEGAEVAEVGDGGGDDEGERPVDRDHADPDELARPLAEVWEPKELLENVLVEHLDADVSV